MNKELVVKKCAKCGALVVELNKCNCENCGIKCCGEEMKVLAPNTVDAAVEKHKPTYEIVDGMLKVKVNHVMEEEHYIEWICIVGDNINIMKKLNPNEVAEFTCEYSENVEIYSYCNKHGLWKTEVK